MEAPRYFLSHDSFLCLADEYYVVLQVIHDKYLCIEKQDFELLTPWLHGWKGMSECASSEIPLQTLLLANELLERGVLTQDSRHGKSAALSEFHRPSTSFVEYQAHLSPMIATHAWSFLYATRQANNLLRKKPFVDTVERIKRRKYTKCSDAIRFNPTTTARLVERFNAFRPFFSRDYLCLFDSLALIEFLAKHNVFPTWIFGVQANPFAAHCWVQQEDIVLNASLEEVGLYTPIMAI